MSLRHPPALPLAALLALAVFLSLACSQPAGSAGRAESADDRARQLIAKGSCPCGCGKDLPGSGSAAACFGCSVGRAEVTFIRESLAEGRSLGQILMALRELVLVEVFADYSDPRLPEVWQRARRAADELGQHRVVLRTPGLAEDARRALAFAECARGSGRFTRVQSALIAHEGPWDEASLTEVAWGALRGADAAAADFESAGDDAWTREWLGRCAKDVDLSAQIAKDRSHMEQRAMRSLPAVSVNRESVSDTLESMRRAIRAALRESSI